MALYQLIRTQKLPITADVAWAFFANPSNLLQLSPGSVQMTDESLEHPRAIYAGLLQTYRIKLLGVIPARWVAQITHVDAPRWFVDEQKLGPFAFWHHKHEIVEVPGGVEVLDTVHYAMPFGFLGAWAHAWVVRRQIEQLFDYRQRMLDEFFGTLS